MNSHIGCLDLDQFQLGTLSHTINTRAQGYQELPDWPEMAPDPSVRNVDVMMPWPVAGAVGKGKSKKTKPEKKKSFYSENESSSAGGYQLRVP